MRVSSSTKVFVAGMLLLLAVSIAAIPQAKRKAELVQQEFESIPVPPEMQTIKISENHKPGSAYRLARFTTDDRKPEELWEFYKKELRNLGWSLCEQKSVQRNGQKLWVARYCKGDLEAEVELPTEPYSSGQTAYSVSVRWSW